MDKTFEERQKRENEEYYRKWLACGFKSEKSEMPVNEYGWFVPVLRLHHPVETLTVFDKKGYRASIEFCQLPNNRWVAASDLTCPMHGYGSACSIWDPQFDTKEEAITAELDRIEKALQDKDRKPFVLQALQAQRNNYKQVEIEMAFQPMTQFEQVSLF